MTSRPLPCPCGLAPSRPYAACCGRLIDAGQPAESAEQLMRSRYTAYATGRNDYLLTTWHADTRPATLTVESPAPKWIGLEIRGHRQLDATHAEVEFVARYRIDGHGHRLHERSRFVCADGRWLYVDGDHLDALPPLSEI